MRPNGYVDFSKFASYSETYLIFSLSEIHKIDFSQVIETSIERLRLSVNQEKSFISWRGEEPTFLVNLQTKEGPYSQPEIVEILNSKEWTKSISIGIVTSNGNT